MYSREEITRWLVLLFAALCLSACAGGKTYLETNGHVEPTQPERTPSLTTGEPPYAADANILRESAYYSPFQDLRAHKVGDLVTVNVVETSKASKKADTKTARSSSINAGINNALGYEGELGRFFPSGFDNNVMFKASMANTFDGSGSTSRDETMTAAITTRVLKVMPNGNLYIEGTRQIKVNNEVQFITLSGLIRPTDISPDNTVLSSFIADAKIEYTGSGPVSDKQRPGWLARILDVVWPF